MRGKVDMCAVSIGRLVNFQGSVNFRLQSPTHCTDSTDAVFPFRGFT